MAIQSLIIIACVALGLAQSQDLVGYTKIADQDFIDAGPLTTIRQDITTMQACADACTQDGQCQAFLFTSICWLYRLRRCMTPPVHDNVFPPPEQGPVYEKNSPVQIPGDSQIITVCGNYSGAVISSTVTTVPNGPNSVSDRLAFTNSCSQSCATQTGPNCHSWRVLQIFENNPNTPIELRCTLYADSIYDVDNQRGFISIMNGACKRAQSIYGINGATTSFLNCVRTSPGTGADPGAPIGSSIVGSGSNPSTIGGDSGIVTAPGPSSSSSNVPPPSSDNMTTTSPGASSSSSSSAPDSPRSSMSSSSVPPSSIYRIITTSPVVGADVDKDDAKAPTSMASGSAPVVVLLVFLKMLAMLA